MTIRRLAIVDRGDAALRIMQAIRECDAPPVVTIALYTDADRRALFVRVADDAVGLGCASFVDARDGLGKSRYLDVEALADALVQSRADAAWAGWGAAGGDPALAELCARLDIAYVGSPPEVLRRLQNPVAIGLLAAEVGIPVAGVPGVSLERHARRLTVPVLADRHGTVWACDPCETAAWHDEVVVEETPSTVATRDEQATLRAGARRLARAAGLVGAGTAVFKWDPATRVFAFDALRAGLERGHALTEATTGLDVVKLALRVARGEPLADAMPPPRGHALSVRIRAADPADGLTPAPGQVELLRLPLGPGVRVDAAVAEGDAVPSDFDPVIATLTVQGADRAEALARMRRALVETAIVVRGGTTTLPLLRLLVSRPEMQTGDAPSGWLEQLDVRSALLAGGHAEVAVLAAAVESYESDAALALAQFLAGAVRGRPRVPEGIGVAVALLYRGRRYALQVRRIAPGRYRVDAGAGPLDVAVDRLGPVERRVTTLDARVRVLVVARGLGYEMEVDGIPHRVGRDAGGVVVAPVPAVVLAIPVAPGTRVAVGERVAVLEAMKMEVPVYAPFAGRVREVLVTANVQVGVGTPLVIVDPDAPPSRDDPGPPLRLVPPAALAVQHPAAPDALRWLVLGFDVTAAEAAAESAAATDPAHTREHAEDLVLEAFADVHALFRRLREVDDDAGTRSTQEHLLGYLRALDTAGEGLPNTFRTRLGRALAHYGVADLDRSPELEAALLRVYVSRARVEEQLAPVIAILERRLAAVRGPARAPDPAFRRLLDRLVATSQGRFPIVADLARELRYRDFDAPLLAAARHTACARAEAALADLPRATLAGRADLVAELVDCPQPLMAILAPRFAGADANTREAMLEVITRRYYRIRRLENVRVERAAGGPRVEATYDLEGTRIQVITAFAEYGALAAALERLAAGADVLPSDRDVMLDLYLWRATGRADVEAIAGELGAQLGALLRRRRLRRVVFVVAGPDTDGATRLQHFTFRPSPEGYAEEVAIRGLHPMMAKRLHLWRLRNFALERLPSPDDVYLFRAVARENPKDERLLALAEVRDATPVRDETGHATQLPDLERMLLEAVAAMRHVQARRPAEERLQWNRILLYVWPPLALSRGELVDLAHRLGPATEGLGLEQVVVRARIPNAAGALEDTIVRITGGGPQGLRLVFDRPPTTPLRPLGTYEQKVLSLRRRGLVYPYEIVAMLTPPRDAQSTGLPPGEFVEHDLDGDGRLVAVTRAPGANAANVVVGRIRSFTAKVPEGMERVILLGDPSREMGSLAEPECRRIIAALALARELRVPLEWFALSAGAKISMDSGTENMDWISRVLRHIVEFTQQGGEINVVVCGITVGAQPYWNAEATMLMHTRGILVMTPDATMVLTGKQALDYSGSVSAEDNLGIGGYERIMGPNGQAQYAAGDLGEACAILLRHYEHTYVVPGERFPRRSASTDPVDRDVCREPHGGADFATVGEVLSDAGNPGRRKAFEVRRVMAAVVDRDSKPLERWPHMRDAEIAVVWDAHLGGMPICLIGIESHPVRRLGFVPADGPEQWAAGTLFPRASKKLARALNAASSNRPVVVLANLSGFDGSPESMRKLQLEYGAEIGRAVVNFRGPIVFCVISRYHGGAFVVFSRALNEHLEAAALEGTYASVIGGAPAAAVVFARDVDRRTRSDPRIVPLERELAASSAEARVALRARLAALRARVRSEQLGVVAEEFDHVHSVERALRMGSLDHIIPAARLRPYLVEAVERGMRRWERAGGDRTS